jgi:hypothetical protein
VRRALSLEGLDVTLLNSCTTLLAVLSYSQMGWNSKLDSQRVTVRDIDVIHVCYCCRPDGSCDSSDNEAIVDLAPDGTSVFDLADITISDVRVECDAVRLLYIQVSDSDMLPITGNVISKGLSEFVIACPSVCRRCPSFQMPSGSSGSFARLTIANVSAPLQSLPARWGMPSNVLSTAPGAGGSIAGVAFVNVSVGGTCWRDASDAHLVTSGSVSGLAYVC